MGFLEAIGRVQDLKLPADNAAVIDKKTTAGKAEMKAKKANETAMASLTMAITTDSLIGMINRSCNTTWPNGLACKVVDALFKQYVPQDIISKIEMCQA